MLSRLISFSLHWVLQPNPQQVVAFWQKFSCTMLLNFLYCSRHRHRLHHRQALLRTGRMGSRRRGNRRRGRRRRSNGAMPCAGAVSTAIATAISFFRQQGLARQRMLRLGPCLVRTSWIPALIFIISTSIDGQGFHFGLIHPQMLHLLFEGLQVLGLVAKGFLRVFLGFLRVFD